MYKYIDNSVCNCRGAVVQGLRGASAVRGVATRGRGAAGGVARLVGARRLPAPAPRRAHAAEAPARGLRQGGGRRPARDEASQPRDETPRGEKQVPVHVHAHFVSKFIHSFK